MKITLIYVLLFLFTEGRYSKACPDLEHSASVAEQNIAWFSELVDWSRALRNWKGVAERECSISDADEHWKHVFECVDFSGIECTVPLEMIHDVDGLNCPVRHCTNGHYVDQRYLSAVWKEYFSQYKKVMAIYNNQLRHCRKSADCNATNSQTTTMTIPPTEDTITRQQQGTAALMSTTVTAYERDNPTISPRVDSTAMPTTTNEDAAYVDIIILVDGSQSIGPSNFQILRQWTIDLTLAIYRRFGSLAQVEVVQYSYKPPDYLGIPITNSEYFEIPLTLGECVDNDTCIIDRITNMRYLSRSTYTYYGLRRASEVEFIRSSRFPQANRVVVVVTDGRANDVANLMPWWDKYGATGWLIPFAVGVGNYKDFVNQLSTIANGDFGDSKVYTMDSFGGLRAVTSQLVNDISISITAEACSWKWISPTNTTITRSLGYPITFSVSVNDALTDKVFLTWKSNSADLSVEKYNAINTSFTSLANPRLVSTSFLPQSVGNIYSMTFNSAGVSVADNGTSITVTSQACITGGTSPAVTLIVEYCDLAAFQAEANAVSTSDCGFNCMREFICISNSTLSFQATCKEDATWGAPSSEERCK